MTERTTARLVGALFIIATIAAIVGGVLVMPVEAPDALVDVAAADARVVSGVLVELILVLSVVGIAALALPVLRRCDEGLAVGYLGARLIEGVLLLAAAISALVVLALSRGEQDAGAQLQVDVAVAAREWTYLVGSMVLLGVGGVILYSLLYRGRLVPAWLSVWGLAAAVTIMVRGALEMYGLDLPVAWQAALAAPIAVNEMVLAGWLIVKGFNPPVGASDAARRAPVRQ